MSAAIYDTVSVSIQSGRFDWKANWRTLIFDDFLKLCEGGRDSKHAGEEKEEEEPMLPTVAEGQPMICEKITPSQHFTKLPVNFTEASLVKDLEKRGIGRPSTYASIISVLKARDYVTVEYKNFYLTDIGKVVSQTLVENFPERINVEFTAEMEKQLDQVAEGERDWRWRRSILAKSAGSR